MISEKSKKAGWSGCFIMFLFVFAVNVLSCGGSHKKVKPSSANKDLESLKTVISQAKAKVEILKTFFVIGSEEEASSSSLFELIELVENTGDEQLIRLFKEDFPNESTDKDGKDKDFLEYLMTSLKKDLDEIIGKTEAVFVCKVNTDQKVLNERFCKLNLMAQVLIIFLDFDTDENFGFFSNMAVVSSTRDDILIASFKELIDAEDVDSVVKDFIFVLVDRFIASCDRI